MVEYHHAVIKADVAIGQFEVIDGTARKFRLNKIFQFIAPATETAAERKGQVYLIQQFATRQQCVQDLPGIAKLNERRETWGVRRDFAAGAEGTEGEKRPRRDKGIACLRRIKR